MEKKVIRGYILCRLCSGKLSSLQSTSYEKAGMRTRKSMPHTYTRRDYKRVFNSINPRLDFQQATRGQLASRQIVPTYVLPIIQPRRCNMHFQVRVGLPYTLIPFALSPRVFHVAVRIAELETQTGPVNVVERRSGGTERGRASARHG